MSVLGQNPTRDKMAKAIIYGGGTLLFYSIKALALANVSNMGAIYKIWFQQAKKRKDIKNKAWELYCKTGDIWNSLDPFISGSE